MGPQASHHWIWLKFREIFSRQPMESLSDSRDVCEYLLVLDSSKTILDTLQLLNIKSREAPKQGIAIVKSSINQSIYR